MKHTALIALIAACTVFTGPHRPAAADDHEPIVTVEIDLAAFHESDLGKSLIEAGAKLAAQQMEKDPEEAMSALIESLGFDPIKQELHVSLSVSDLDDPLEDMTVDVQLKDSTGNLEGLLLAAPGYEVAEVGGQKIHSVSMDGQPFHITFCDGANGKKHVIAAPSPEIVTAAAKAAASGSASDRAGDGEMILVQLHQMPEEVAEVPPVANIAGMIMESNLAIKDVDDDLILSINLTADTEERAKQLQQLVQGAVAMVGLFKEEIQNELQGEEVASAMISVLDKINVDLQETKVSIIASIPESLIMTFLREEADLPL
ncbi:MAG: hypothetical protein AAF802_21760 [Planctomycetota bacterium]